MGGQLSAHPYSIAPTKIHGSVVFSRYCPLGHRIDNGKGRQKECFVGVIFLLFSKKRPDGVSAHPLERLGVQDPDLPARHGNMARILQGVQGPVERTARASQQLRQQGLVAG